MRKKKIQKYKAGLHPLVSYQPQVTKKRKRSYISKKEKKKSYKKREEKKKVGSEEDADGRVSPLGEERIPSTLRFVRGFMNQRIGEGVSVVYQAAKKRRMRKAE
jgi:hypothetical protein